MESFLIMLDKQGRIVKHKGGMCLAFMRQVYSINCKRFQKYSVAKR